MDINYKTVCKEAKKNINNLAIKNYAGHNSIVQAIYYILDKKYDLRNIVEIAVIFNIKNLHSNRIWEETEYALMNIYKEVNSGTLLVNE